MEFADYLAILRRRWWLIALAVVTCVTGAVVATELQTPEYRTSTRLLVSASASENAIDEITKRQLSTQRAGAYANYATTGPAVQAALEEAGVAGGPQVKASADGSTPFITITVTDTDPRAAAAVANAYVKVLPRVVTELDQAPSGTSLPQLSVLEAAGVPGEPFSPDPVRNYAVGLVLGLVLGFAAALLRESLDATVRQSSEIEKLTGVGLIGVIPKEYGDERLIAVTRPRSRRTEAYRHIRTNLEFAGPDGAPRSFVITSAGPGEGKTTVAANLAVIASHAGKNVVLVDADLRKPTVAEVMKLQSSPGLSDVLSGASSLERALQPLAGERITVLTSGPLPTSPSELLGSTAMLEVIEELERLFDLVVIDCAPVLPVTDALVVGVNTGGVLIVTRLASTTRSALRKTVDAVRRVDARLLGVVANGTIEEEDKRYGYGYGYLSDKQAKAEDLRPVAHIAAAPRRRAAADPAPEPATTPTTAQAKARARKSVTAPHSPPVAAVAAEPPPAVAEPEEPAASTVEAVATPMVAAAPAVAGAEATTPLTRATAPDPAQSALAPPGEHAARTADVPKPAPMAAAPTRPPAAIDRTAGRGLFRRR